MKLYAPEFEKTLKRSVRAAVRQDARLRKEYRRTRVRRQPTWIRWLVRLLFSCVLAASVSTVLNLTGHPETALAVVTLWTLGFASFLSSLLAPVWLHGSDVRALQLLPVSGATIYKFRRDKIVGFHLMTVFDLLAGLGTLAFAMKLPWLDWLGLPPIVALASVFSVALAMFAGAIFPRFKTGWVAFGVMLLFSAWVLGNKYDGPQMMAAFDFAAPVINLLVPTGWPPEFFHWLARDGWWPPLVVVVPLGCVIWSYKKCEQMVIDRFPYQEPAVHLKLPEQIPAGMARAPGEPDRTIGVTAITEGILSRECFALPRWDQEWPQRLLWRWLTPRERVVADFIFARPLAMVRPWIRILWHFLAAVVVWEVFRILLPSIERLMLIVTMALPAAEILSQSSPAGAAFRRVRNFGVHISLLAPYPIGFQELTGLLLKCTIFQLPVVTVLVTALCIVVEEGKGMALLPAASMGLRVTLVLVALRLALLALNFASVSNDTSRSVGRIWLALLICMIEICVVCGLAMAALMAPDEAPAWLAATALIATQYGFLRFYGWLWNRGSIDLMSLDAK